MVSESRTMVSFGDICRHSAFGPRFSSKEYAVNGNIACLRTKDISVDGRIELTTMPLAILDHKKFSNHFLQKNDLVITRTGRVGTTAVFSDFMIPVVPGAFLIRFRLDESQAYPQFYRYFFNSPTGQNLIHSVATGSVQQNLNITNLHTLTIPLPPLTEQHAIAHILGSLDDKIELNRQMNATLESMAQALFKSWFVDFDPVIDNALAAGNPIPEPLHGRAKTRKALGDKRKPLLEAIQKQFPSRFIFSEEMGWFPDGWQLKSLDHIANYQNGLALQKFRPEKEYDFLPVIKIAQLRKGYADGEEKASPNINPECIIDDGDVVFSWSGSLMVDVWCGGKGALNQHLFKVTSSKFPRWFFYEYTKFHLIEFQRIAADKAVTMGHIKREHLRQAFCLVPSQGLFERCSPMVESLLERYVYLRKQNKQLEILRDSLLPKLLSGQLRVPEAEKLMAEAL